MSVLNGLGDEVFSSLETKSEAILLFIARFASV
jgi:hypothetical protein